MLRCLYLEEFLFYIFFLKKSASRRVSSVWRHTSTLPSPQQREKDGAYTRTEMLSTGFSVDTCDFYRPCRLLVLLCLCGEALFMWVDVLPPSVRSLKTLLSTQTHSCRRCHQEVVGLQLNNGAGDSVHIHIWMLTWYLSSVLFTKETCFGSRTFIT